MRARNHLLGLVAALIVFVALVGGGVWMWSGDDQPAAPGATAVPAATASPTAQPPSPTPTVAELPSNEAVAALKSAQHLFREGRYGEAHAAFVRLATDARIASERGEALVGAGNAARALNDREGGITAYQDAARAAPAGFALSARAHYLLVKALNDSGRLEEAAAVFRAAPLAAAGSPLDPYYRFEGGRADWWPAGNAIWAGLLSDPAVSPALKTSIRQELISRWRDRGDTKGLKPALDDLIDDTGSPSARLERADIALAEGDTDNAAFQLGAIVVEAPGSIYSGFALKRLEANGLSVDPGAAGLSY